MTQCHWRSVIAGLTALGLVWGGAAQAQDEAPVERIRPPPDSAVISGVTVSVPKVVERTRYGVVTKELSMSARVPFRDLDMRTPAGVAELDRRVAEAADYICRQLEIMYPDGTPEEYYCVRQAIGEAQPQVLLARSPG